jgi:3-hydroxybutyryl-CoA dehydrogenase
MLATDHGGAARAGAADLATARVAVIGPGRIGRQIALAFALGGARVVLADVKARPESEATAALDDARREIARDLVLMVEEGVVAEGVAAAVRQRIETRTGLGDLAECGFVQEALPESAPVKRQLFEQLADAVSPTAVIASTSSTISPSDLMDAVQGPERFLVAHWLNPAHIVPLVEVVPSPRTAPATVARTLALLEGLGKVAVRCGDSPGFIGPRLQVLLMNEAVRLVEEGVATPEDVDRAFCAGMGFRYASVGIFEFIDWGGVDVLYRASRYMAEATSDARFAPAALVTTKMHANELGPKTGRGFFDYSGDRREAFESAKVRALLRQLKQARGVPGPAGGVPGPAGGAPGKAG